MSSERINKLLGLTKQDIIELFVPFDASLEILDFVLMTDSMSNTGYMVITSTQTYLLKLYSNATDEVETAAYNYLKDKINVPELHFYDGRKTKFPFAYTIAEFINGITFRKYIQDNMSYPLEVVFEIGKMCSIINQKKYEKSFSLDNQLKPQSQLPDTREKILYMLKNKPGTYLKPQTISSLNKYIEENVDLFNRLDEANVFCHGDLNYGNIILLNGKVYFVDFEFAYAGSRYHDIGHFFRRKDDDVQALINNVIYNTFADGYNSVSTTTLPHDWLKLAQLCDLSAMLCLLDNDNIPDYWVEDIEKDILSAID